MPRPLILPAFLKNLYSPVLPDIRHRMPLVLLICKSSNHYPNKASCMLFDARMGQTQSVDSAWPQKWATWTGYRLPG